MYAAIRAETGDQVTNTLSRDRDRYEVFMTPEQTRALHDVNLYVKPGLFALWNLNHHHLEYKSLNEKGWILL